MMLTESLLLLAHQFHHTLKHSSKRTLCESLHSLQGFTSQPKQFQSYFMCIYSIAYKVYKKGRKKLESEMQEQG